MNEMSIAVIGWGSLIWCPGALQIKSRWHSDGPMLPIEFARISSDGRLTLVIHSGAREVRTHWALSVFSTLEEARGNLRDREGTTKSRIGVVRRNNDNASSVPGAAAVQRWLNDKHGLDGAIWTALESNWEERRGGKFAVEDAVRYLSELERQRDEISLRYGRACEYIRNTPDTIQTEVRTLLNNKPDFKSATLAPALFDSTGDV